MTDDLSTQPDSDVVVDDVVDVAFDLTDADNAVEADDDVEIVDDPWTRPGAWYVEIGRAHV